MLFAACVGLRMVGAGLMSLLSTNALAAWFDRKLGLACGLMQFGGAASVALAPLGLAMLIDGVGWRTAYVLLGLGLLGGLWPLVALAYREHPSDVGQYLDGDPGPPGPRRRPSDGRSAPTARLRVVDANHPPSLNLSEALETRIFWLLLISTAVWSLIATGLMFHLESLLAACRVRPAEAAWATPLLAGAMAVVQLGGGVLVDRVSVRRLLTTALLCVAAGCVVLANITGSFALAAYGVYGVGQGLMTLVSGASWAKYFGPGHLGRIRGAAMTVGIGCSAMGPLAMGASADYLGGFEPSLWLFTAVALLVAAAGGLMGCGDGALAEQ
jgi:MFS family permease